MIGDRLHLEKGQYTRRETRYDDVTFMNHNEPSSESIVDRVVASQQFRKSAIHRDLLLYLWRNRETSVSEYAIGLDVLSRRADFDPKTDATVRVHMSRLRQRLKEYYESAGKEDPTQIQIPMGEYRIELQEAPRVEANPPTAPKSRRLPIVAIFLAVTCLALFVDDIRLRTVGQQLPAVDAFWAPIVHPGKQIPIIVPAPLFFRWDKLPYVARDFRVNSLDEVNNSPLLEMLRQKFGPLEVSQLYTVASDTLAASVVSRYLDDRGVPAFVVDTPGATLELLSSQDAVVFVGPGTSVQLGPIMDRTGYTFRPGAGVLVDRKAKPGEAVEYPNVIHSPLRSTSYGSIALLPGRASGTVMLAAASSFNPALATLLTTGAELETLRAFLKQKGILSRHFEVLIRYEVSAQKVLSVAPIAARRIEP